MTLLPIVMRRAAPTVAALVFGWNAFDTVKPPRAGGLPWDWYVHWLALAFGVLVVWLAMSVVCAGVRMAALRLHRLQRWTAYLALVLLAYSVPTLPLIPELAAMTICRGSSCAVSANVDGLGIIVPKLIRPNLVTWICVAPLSIVVAAWMASWEQRLAGHEQVVEVLRHPMVQSFEPVLELYPAPNNACFQVVPNFLHTPQSAGPRELLA